jgi:hypothetical protein
MQMVQKEMSDYFMSQPNDLGTQMSMRANYLTMFWHIENMAAPVTGAEKAVAKRKLLESMDAAMRALSQ